MIPSSSPTPSPCILHSRVSRSAIIIIIIIINISQTGADGFACIFTAILHHHFPSSLFHPLACSFPFSSQRNMELLPESAGEEICNWEKWSERAGWTHIWLRPRWCQGLGWEDKRVSAIFFLSIWFIFNTHKGWINGDIVYRDTGKRRERFAHLFLLLLQVRKRGDTGPYSFLCGPDQLLGLLAGCRLVQRPTQQRCLHPAAQSQQRRDLQRKEHHASTRVKAF